MRRALRIVAWAIPVVAVAVCILDVIVLGPICISVDCTGAQPHWQRSTAVFELALLVLIGWLLIAGIYWLVRSLRR